MSNHCHFILESKVLTKCVLQIVVRSTLPARSSSIMHVMAAEFNSFMNVQHGKNGRDKRQILQNKLSLVQKHTLHSFNRLAIISLSCSNIGLPASVLMPNW